MNKIQMLYEMAVLGCVRNPQAHTAEECSICDFQQGMCNAYRHAEALYNAGYRKVPEEMTIGQPMSAESEIERLKAQNEQLTKIIEKVVAEKCNDNCKVAKAYVKEFAEKLKSEMGEHYNTDVSEVYEIINEVLKEYEK